MVYYCQGVGNFEIVSFVVESGRKLVSYFSKFPGYHNKVNRVYLCIDGDLQYSGNISALSWYGKNKGKNHKQTEKNMNKWNKEYKKKMSQAPGNNLSDISAKS